MKLNLKKCLPFVLTVSLLFSMVSSAFAVEATLDTQAKFDTLKAKGVFEGRETGAELEKTMTRAEFAKVIVKLLNLKERVIDSSVYTDLEEASWAKGFIGAVAPTYMEGTEVGKFNPNSQVTTEQMAVILVRALKLQVDTSATVEGKVSDWAKGYVAAAIKANIVKNRSDFTQPALRSELVESTYVAISLVPAAEAGNAIAEAEQTGAAKITIKLNGAVDVKKAKFDVALNDSVVKVTEVKWEENKASADLNLETKLVEGTYVVTLSGLDNLDAAKAKAEVKAEAEKIAKIDFINGSEVIPRAEEVRLYFKVMNQYGEDTKTPASQLKIRSNMREEDWKAISGESAIELNTDAPKSAADNDNEYEYNEHINFMITHEDSAVSTNKIFTIGDEQIVSKVEIGQMMDASGNEIGSVESGDYAYLQVAAYDQYGIQVVNEEKMEDAITFSGDDLSAGTPKGDDDEMFNDDVNDDHFKDLKFYVDADIDQGDYTITLFHSGGSAVKVVKIRTPDEPASISFSSSTLSFAEGDGEYGTTDTSSTLFTKYIPFMVKNAEGKELTKDEIVSAVDKFKIDDSGSIKVEGIVRSGAYKGQLKVKKLKNGSGSITVALDDKPEIKATLKVNVGKIREVQEIRLTGNNGNRGFNLGSDSLDKAVTCFNFKTYDQYDMEAKEDLYRDKDGNALDYKVALTFNGPSDSTAPIYNVEVFDDLIGQTMKNKLSSSDGFSVGNTVYGTLNSMFDKEFKFKADKVGTYKIKAELLQWNSSTKKYSVVDNAIKTYELIDASDENFTWTASLADAVMDGEKNVLKKIDAGTKFHFDANNDGVIDLSESLGSIAARDLTYYPYKVNGTALDTNFRDAGKEIKITVKDGNDTILAPNVITAVYSTNAKVVEGYALSSTSDVYLAWLYGYDTGDADVTIRFRTNKGMNTASLKVVVKDAPINISTISGGKLTRDVNINYLTGSYDPNDADYNVNKKKIHDGLLLDEVNAKDKVYGNSFVKDEFAKYADLLGITYVVTEKQDPYDTLTISTDGSINFNDGYNAADPQSVKGNGSFKIKVAAPSGAEQVQELFFFTP